MYSITELLSTEGTFSDPHYSAYRDLQECLYDEYLPNLLDFKSSPRPAQIVRDCFDNYRLYMEGVCCPATYFRLMRQDVYRIFMACGFATNEAETELSDFNFILYVQAKLPNVRK